MESDELKNSHRFIGWEYVGIKGAKRFMIASTAIMDIARSNSELIYGEQRLMFATIHQAVHDALNIGKSHHARATKRDAQFWLSSKRMEPFCEAIDLNPFLLRSLLKRVMDDYQSRESVIKEEICA